MATDAQKRATAKYNREHSTYISLKLNRETDADIIGQLAAQQNRQGYIKDLIRQDMKKSPK